MKQKKIWFNGITSRLWLPVSIEGWLVTAAFFGGISLIHRLNPVPADAPLGISQIVPILLEFAVLLGILYWLTRGHVDKKY